MKKIVLLYLHIRPPLRLQNLLLPDVCRRLEIFQPKRFEVGRDLESKETTKMDL